MEMRFTFIPTLVTDHFLGRLAVLGYWTKNENGSQPENRPRGINGFTNEWDRAE